jgi:AraC-like DNA-binding protein
MYTELPVDLDGAVLWTSSGGRPGPARVLPDGSLDLIWRGDGVLLVAGPDTTAQVSDGDALSYVGVRFAPGQGPSVLGLPAHEVTDARVPLDVLWTAGRAARLVEQITAAPDPAQGLAAAVRRLLDRADPDRLSREVARRLNRGERVERVASAVSLSPRHLHRRSLVAFGYGPKTLARVLRFNRALSLARTGLGLTRVAADCGYADQAHLARDVRDLAGVPLTTLLAD